MGKNLISQTCIAPDFVFIQKDKLSILQNTLNSVDKFYNTKKKESRILKTMEE